MKQRLEKQQTRSVELRAGFSKRPNKIDKYLARPRGKNKQRNKIIKIRNEGEDIMMDTIKQKESKKL